MNVVSWYNAVRQRWRGARVDDWGGLENRCGLRATVGSNPTLSALRFLISDFRFVIGGVRGYRLRRLSLIDTNEKLSRGGSLTFSV